MPELLIALRGCNMTFLREAKMMMMMMMMMMI